MPGWSPSNLPAPEPAKAGCSASFSVSGDDNILCEIKGSHAHGAIVNGECKHAGSCQMKCQDGAWAVIVNRYNSRD